MLGTNKNQCIHEIMTSIQGLDKYKPYGNLSVLYTGDFKQLGTECNKPYLNIKINYILEPVLDPFLFKSPTVHGRSRAAENLWKLFRNYHLTEKVRSAEDKDFSSLCDRVGYNNLTLRDIEYLKSRNIPCPYEDDPENFKLGKVLLTDAKLLLYKITFLGCLYCS